MDEVSRLRHMFYALERDLLELGPEKNLDPAVERLWARMRKRARLGDDSLEAVAVSSFLTVNDRMSSLSIDLPDGIVRDSRHFLLNMLENYTTSVMAHDIQVSLDFVHLLDLWRFGPGASFETEGSHPALKMGQDWTTSHNATAVVSRIRRNHPYLSFHDASKHQAEMTPGIVGVRGSQLKTVPKNEETNRTIAFEPCGNMCAQLAAGEYIRLALRRIGLDITEQQPLNKALARMGSLDGSLATIDLSSASDCIHPDLVRALWPSEWYDLLMSVRSEEILLPSGQWVKANMISTMGNGFTFSLMTATIVALLYGFRAQRRGSPTLWIDWNTSAVYGDDIIIPTEEYEPFTSVLTRAGFLVNHEKSFCAGPFRESCGGDYWLGRDITPFYIKSLRNDGEIYIALNKVTAWMAREKIFLPDTLTFLFGQLKGKLLLVPEWHGDDAGFRTSQVHRRYTFLKPVQLRATLEDKRFVYPLACARYVQSGDADLVFYLPRQFKTRYCKVRTRLPRGFLEGRVSDHVRDPNVRSYADLVASLGASLFPA